MCNVPAFFGGDPKLYCECRAKRHEAIIAECEELKGKIVGTIQGSYVPVGQLKAIYGILRTDKISIH